MPTQKKIETVETIKSRWNNVGTAILANYRGLTVEQITDLRRQLKTVKAECKVVKNRLAMLAVKDSEMDKLAPYFRGPIAVIYTSHEPIPLVKVLQSSLKNYPQLEIKAGYIQGEIIKPEDMKSLAEMPPREVLLGRVIGGMQAPITCLVSYLNGIMANLLLTIKAIEAKK